jgi:hypothetical protein
MALARSLRASRTSANICVNTVKNMTLQTRSEMREIFSVDGLRVTLDDRHGWQCECAAHSAGLECAHVARAAIYKQMRGVRRESDDTIELELTPTELQTITSTAVVESTPIGRNRRVSRKRRLVRVSRWAAIAAAASVAGVSSGITYLATAQRGAAPVAEPVVMPAVLTESEPGETIDPADTTVKIANPFDASEVFEFPASMSESDARDAVAEFLLQRARERLGRPPSLHHADEASPAPRAALVTDVAQRS